MKPQTQVVVRWIAVLPVAILSGALSAVVLHAVLVLTFVKGEVISGMNISPIEWWASPFVTACGFVLGGHKMAPQHRQGVAVGMVGLLFVSMAVLLVLIPEQTRLGARSVVSIAGAFLGLYLARDRNGAR